MINFNFHAKGRSSFFLKYYLKLFKISFKKIKLRNSEESTLLIHHLAPQGHQLPTPFDIFSVKKFFYTNKILIKKNLTKDGNIFDNEIRENKK